MYSIEKLELRLEDYYEQLLDRRHNTEKNCYLITRLFCIKNQLIEAEDLYEKFGENNELYNIVETLKLDLPNNINKTLEQAPPRLKKTVSLNSVSKDEMEKVYTEFFVGEDDEEKIGRQKYNEIKANTKYGKCPYCSQSRANTLDHYLPKSKFILYAVTPANLLPCCRDCNAYKLDSINKDNKLFIHPYFEDLSNIEWLDCKIIEKQYPITFRYSVSEQIGARLKNRIKNQFNLLKLNELYSNEAANELQNKKTQMEKEFNKIGCLTFFFEDSIDTYSHANKNSWQTQMYRSLKESEWFNTVAVKTFEKI